MKRNQHFRHFRAEARRAVPQCTHSVCHAVLQRSDDLWLCRKLILREFVGGVVAFSPVRSICHVVIPERHVRKRFQSGSVFITTNFRKAFRTACVKVGLGRKIGSKEWQYEGLLPYDLRRSAIRNPKCAGVQETVAMKISGNKTRAVFDRYNITDVDDVKQAMKKVTQYNASSMQVGRKRSKQK